MKIDWSYQAKKILVSAMVFIAAGLVLCLAAKLMQREDRAAAQTETATKDAGTEELAVTVSKDEEPNVALTDEQILPAEPVNDASEPEKKQESLVYGQEAAAAAAVVSAAQSSQKAEASQKQETEVEEKQPAKQENVTEEKQPAKQENVTEEKKTAKQETVTEEKEPIKQETVTEEKEPIKQETVTEEKKPAKQETTSDQITFTKTDSEAHVVAINAAHQGVPNLDPEPLGPGAKETKVKSGWGSVGVSTETEEYDLNLIIALKLRDILEDRGYEVLMLRETNDVNISDATRAQTANAYADIAIHIHSNSDERERISGIMAFYPSEDNPYAADYSEACRILSKTLLRGLAKATGAKNWGPIDLDTQSTLNWTKIPASHVEIGFLSNYEEDELLQTEEYRNKIAVGLADGVDSYFASH